MLWSTTPFTVDDRYVPFFTSPNIGTRAQWRLLALLDSIRVPPPILNQAVGPIVWVGSSSPNMEISDMIGLM